MIIIKTKNGISMPVRTFKFPAGEIQLQCPIPPGEIAEVMARLNSSDDIMELLLLDELLHQKKAYDRELTIPYLPYGRQDRVMQKDEAFSLKVMAKLLNNTCFSRIVTYDCHSPVTNALIDNLYEIDQLECILINRELKLLQTINGSVLIAPDAGAAKKTYKVAQLFQRPMIVAEKIRDTITGDITRTRVDTSAINNCLSALIIDDICDGGRTFIELAKALKMGGFQKVYLYVTHGIFSQGMNVFDGLIDHIFTTNTFLHETSIKENPILTISETIV